MEKLHKTSHNGILGLAPNVEKRGFSCDESVPLAPQRSLSNDTFDALEELGEVLKGIHKRMISEGYELVGGTIQKAVS